MFSRRLFLAGTLAWGLAAIAHTPYQQWVVYRKKFLLIGTCRSDPKSYPFGQALAVLLAEQLPESKARVARAPHPQRLASLLTTDQLNLILLTHLEAEQLYRGEAPFSDYGPYPLQLIYGFDDYLLVSNASFPDYHAWLVAKNLAVKHTLIKSDAVSIPTHPGSQAYLSGTTLTPEAAYTTPPVSPGAPQPPPSP